MKSCPSSFLSFYLAFFIASAIAVCATNTEYERRRLRTHGSTFSSQSGSTTGTDRAPCHYEILNRTMMIQSDDGSESKNTTVHYPVQVVAMSESTSTAKEPAAKQNTEDAMFRLMMPPVGYDSMCDPVSTSVLLELIMKIKVAANNSISMDDLQRYYSDFPIGLVLPVSGSVCTLTDVYANAMELNSNLVEVLNLKHQPIQYLIIPSIFDDDGNDISGFFAMQPHADNDCDTTTSTSAATSSSGSVKESISIISVPIKDLKDIQRTIELGILQDMPATGDGRTGSSSDPHLLEKGTLNWSLKSVLLSNPDGIATAPKTAEQPPAVIDPSTSMMEPSSNVQTRRVIVASHVCFGILIIASIAGTLYIHERFTRSSRAEAQRVREEKMRRFKHLLSKSECDAILEETVYQNDLFQKLTATSTLKKKGGTSSASMAMKRSTSNNRIVDVVPVQQKDTSTMPAMSNHTTSGQTTSTTMLSLCGTTPDNSNDEASACSVSADDERSAQGSNTEDDNQASSQQQEQQQIAQDRNDTDVEAQLVSTPSSDCSKDVDDDSDKNSTNCDLGDGSSIVPNTNQNGDDGYQEQCPICMEEYVVNETVVVILPRCKHIYHKECICQWLTEKQGCCPMCKMDVL